MDLSGRISPIVLLPLILSCILYLHWVLKWRARSRGRPFPPGPPRLPIIGNMFNIPGDRAWRDFQGLTAQYGGSNSPRQRSKSLTPPILGDIIHFQILGKSTVVLGSPQIIQEYLEKRAGNTSDRVQTPVFDL